MTSPLIPTIDLKDVACAPIDVAALLGSDAWHFASNDPAIGFALINLLLRSWHQVPAASIPDDDELLAMYARVDPATWSKIKAKVLRDWIACDDGRLYHPMIAKYAYEADEARAKHAAFIERQRLAGKKSGEARATPAEKKPSKKSAKTSAPAAVEADAKASIPVPQVDPRQISIFDADKSAVIEFVEAEPVVGESKSAIDAACEAVFDHYKKRLHPKAKFGADRKKLIRGWLKTKPTETDKYTPEELMEAIDGNASSDWHQGNNDRKTAYNEIEFIFRNRSHIEKFQKLARGEVEKNMTPASRLSSAAQQTLDAWKKRQERKGDTGGDSSAGELQ